ncbi:class I SAM-dependent methyltransferase [Butyrivibrio proteoclasticus]|uniref:class I SAM-dependent methyltransferase n=1 Tax=Butyrivibrio proteoclasticus TaxID=43305 RepID=UPI000685167D|nr:class I SAM-dependent methyltransferase [Butyrivibrio proteoclasticus]
MTDKINNNTTDNSDRLQIIKSRMSERLLTVADMLGTAGDNLKVADVGCDHGYVSIYLLLKEIATKAIAMDVRKGPLSGAEKNIAEFGLSQSISTRLSDGLTALKEGEANSVIIAGMGGKLMMRLLSDVSLSKLGIERAVLQPQSELDLFRQFLRDNNYQILEERVIFEDGKYYFPTKVSFANGDSSFNKVLSQVEEELVSKCGCDDARARDICNKFGEHNLLSKDEALKAYLEHGKEVLESVIGNLDPDAHSERYNQVNREIEDIVAALKLID